MSWTPHKNNLTLFINVLYYIIQNPIGREIRAMEKPKLSAIEKLDYIYKSLEGKEGYNADQAKQYAQQVSESVDHLSGRIICSTSPTIPSE